MEVYRPEFAIAPMLGVSVWSGKLLPDIAYLPRTDLLIVAINDGASRHRTPGHLCGVLFFAVVSRRVAVQGIQGFGSYWG